MNQRLEDYSYHLPKESIAQRPCRFRDHSRVLVMDRGSGGLGHSYFHRFPEYLREGDVLVLNDTAVLQARLFAKKAGSGGRVELLLLAPLKGGRWRALLKGKCRPGTRLVFRGVETGARLEGIGEEGEVIVGFDPPGGVTSLIQAAGSPPLPPYIRRGEELARVMKKMDRVRYQTVFASREGSVAAPTAGLHFTRRLLKRVRARGVEVVFLTLHVGPGTFRPLRHSDLSKCRLEAESAVLPAVTARAVRAARKKGGRVVAVGTTVTRVLESFTSADGKIRGGRKRVDLLIRPGHRFRAVDALVTNFHLPRSSLLLLVSAFAGRARVLEAYREAIQSGYRFYSYGDAMLIL